MFIGTCRRSSISRSLAAATLMVAAALAVGAKKPAKVTPVPAEMVKAYHTQWLENIDAAIERHTDKFRQLNQHAARTRSRNRLMELREEGKVIMATKREIQKLRDKVAALSDDQVANTIREAWAEQDELVHLEKTDPRLNKLKDLASAAQLIAREVQKTNVIKSARVAMAGDDVDRNGLKVFCQFEYVTQGGLVRQNNGYIEFHRTKRYYWPHHADVDGDTAIFLDSRFTPGAIRAAGLFDTINLGLPTRAYELTRYRIQYDDMRTYQPDAPARF